MKIFIVDRKEKGEARYGKSKISFSNLFSTVKYLHIKKNIKNERKETAKLGKWTNYIFNKITVQ